MAVNPDVYLLYEYRKKNAFTVRVKVTLTEAVDEVLLTQAAGEAMTRFPYFSVKVGLDEGENYCLLPNDQPIAVLPETDERLVLGSEEVGGHLFAVRRKTPYGSTFRIVSVVRSEPCSGSKRPCIST